jgi:uncharacterized tellurite resistance protein B-like protein
LRAQARTDTTAPMIAEFFAEQNLNFEQVKALTRAMLAVARVDGVHDNEMKLIREFYESCARAGDPRLEEVASGKFDIESVKSLFEGPDLPKLFIKTMILLAFADGKFAKAEDDLIREWANRMGLGREDVDRLTEATKEFLLAGLSHLQNVDALKAAARRLNVQS